MATQTQTHEGAPRDDASAVFSAANSDNYGGSPLQFDTQRIYRKTTNFKGNLDHSLMCSSCFLDVDEDKDPISTRCLTNITCSAL
jgi:hypothetical protein